MREETKHQWDLIGDIHGSYESLIGLLDELGYEREDIFYRHPKGRRVIFVGDFIDRGANSLDVIRVVRNMMDAGQAIAVMGNHEFNFVSYMTSDGQGGHLRKQSKPNTKLVQATLDSFHYRDKELARTVEWMKTLPFFLELDGLRVVHAAWVQEDIDFLQGKSLTDDAFLTAANHKGTREYLAIERVLKGVEAPLPDGITLPDANGIARDSLRVKWWESLSGKSWREIAFPPREDLPNEKAEWRDEGSLESKYPEDALPVFIGHYKLLSYDPFAAAPNIASLDYGLGHGGKATAYRFGGESEINVENFVQVEEEPDHVFEVWIDDNYHFMDEDERFSGGRYGTYAEALQRAHEVVERSLDESYKPGMTAEELEGSYVHFGEDPWITSTPDGEERFSARGHAKARVNAFVEECRKIEAENS